MGFSKALYYPSIDIGDEEWLKSAILFWDEIYTIVPESIKDPYKNHCTQYLKNVGIIKPIIINPYSKYVNRIISDVLKFVNSNVGIQMLNGTMGETKHIDFYMQQEVLHRYKINSYVIDELRRLGRLKLDEKDFYHLNSGFVSFYMTLLANSICEDKSFALVTNNSLNFQLAETIRYDNDVCSTFFTEYNSQHCIPDITLKQGLLTNFIIENIRISETTPLEDIITFRQHYRDELAKFRFSLAQLVSSVNGANSFEALHENIQTIYTDEFTPAYNDLKKALKASKIKWVFDNLSKLCIFSVSSTALPVMLGASIPQAVFFGAGVSVVSSTIAYNINKSEKLSQNPYSYLLKVNKEL